LVRTLFDGLSMNFFLTDLAKSFARQSYNTKIETFFVKSSRLSSFTGEAFLGEFYLPSPRLINDVYASTFAQRDNLIENFDRFKVTRIDETPVENPNYSILDRLVQRYLGAVSGPYRSHDPMTCLRVWSGEVPTGV